MQCLSPLDQSPATRSLPFASAAAASPGSPAVPEAAVCWELALARKLYGYRVSPLGCRGWTSTFSGIQVLLVCAIGQLWVMSPTSAVSGAPCNMEGTDSSRFPLCRKLSTENFSPMLGSDSDTSRWELHVQQAKAISYLPQSQTDSRGLLLLSRGVHCTLWATLTAPPEHSSLCAAGAICEVHWARHGTRRCLTMCFNLRCAQLLIASDLGMRASLEACRTCRGMHLVLFVHLSEQKRRVSRMCKPAI